MSVIHKTLSNIKKAYLNRGFHTDRKILVFESDDWGSIRMPSREVFERLDREQKITDDFLCNDSIEQKEDLTELFSLLSSFKDKNGRHPCITANFAVANPDFENIDYNNGIYCFERFTDTYDRLCGGKEGMLSLINYGMKKHIFRPQLHAREHLNIARWMRDLKNGKADAVCAFNNRMIDVQGSFTSKTKFGYMDALNVDNKAQLKELESVISDAANIFESVFGYKSKTFVASCFIWSKGVEKILTSNGIKMLQTDFMQNVCPFEGTSHMLKKPHYTGQRRKDGLVFSVRNCEYEPVYDHNIQKRTKRCLSDIDKAFETGKPAIVDTHRVNYIGSINADNAKMGREGLGIILSEVQSKYPDVEFLSSDELCDILV